MIVRDLVFVLVGAKRVRSTGFQAAATARFRRGECPVMTVPVPNRADNFPRRGSSNDRLQLARRADLIEREWRMCLLVYARRRLLASMLKGDKRKAR